MTDQPKSLLDAAEAALCEIYGMHSDGVLDWSDASQELLDAWRRERGEAGKSTAWEWWSMIVGEDEYMFTGATRDDVIRQCRDDYPGDLIDVVEARYWTDDFFEDDGGFAETRNHEVIPAAAAG